MHPFTVTFLVFLACGTAFRMWLSLRQIRAMRAGRNAVPSPFDSGIDLADHTKACDYTAAGSRLGLVDHVIDAVLLLGWTVFGGLALLDGLWRGFGLGERKDAARPPRRLAERPGLLH